eukprot:3259483-Amphidinium_carterae.1
MTDLKYSGLKVNDVVKNLTTPKKPTLSRMHVRNDNRGHPVDHGSAMNFREKNNIRMNMGFKNTCMCSPSSPCIVKFFGNDASRGGQMCIVYPIRA